jgi:hypothetical protein
MSTFLLPISLLCLHGKIWRMKMAKKMMFALVLIIVVLFGS